MSFSQYIKDTRVELKHVAWPTQTQTIVYTILVIAVSAFVALYIGFFDFFFTRGLDEVLRMGGVGPAVQTAPAETGETGTSAPVDFDVLPSQSVDSQGEVIVPPAAPANQ